MRGLCSPRWRSHSGRPAPPRRSCGRSAPTVSGTAKTSTAARLEFAAGALRLAAGRPNELYRMDVLYDDERYQPVSDFDAARGNVVLGLRAAGNGGLRVVSKSQLRQTASVTFSPRSDLALGVRSARWTGTSSSAASGSPRSTWRRARAARPSGFHSPTRRGVARPR